MVKSWYKSKTIWWNVIIFLVALGLDIPLDLSASSTIGFASVINIVLRVITKEKLGK